MQTVRHIRTRLLRLAADGTMCRQIRFFKTPHPLRPYRSRQAPGKRTIRHLLRNKGIEVGVYVVSKLMKEMALVSKQPVKKTKHTGGKPHCFLKTASNERLNAKRESRGNVTYIQVNGQWHYLVAVLDLSCRRLAGW